MNLNQRIEALIPTMGGWCTVQRAQDLALAVLKLKAKTVVEIGTFEGRGFLSMAMALKEQGFGIAWAVDPWTNAAAVEGYDKVNADWWGSIDLEAVYQRFLGHVEKQGVKDYVKVVRQKSDDVTPPEVIDVLVVDGQHTEQAVRDVEKFASRVRPMGLVYVDDIEWSSLGPKHAVEKLLTMGFVKLFDRDTGAMFERVPAKTTPKRGWPKGKKRTKK